MEIKKICILCNGTLKEEYNIPNVIRCKDCKYWAVQIENNGEKSYWSLCKKLDRRMCADDFCSRGKRRHSEVAE